MKCPYCTFEDAPRPMHAHLTDRHMEQVEVQQAEGKRSYRITCPICGEYHEQRIKPRGRDPAFVEEYRREIALVGFDMLINHLMSEHDQL